MSSSFDRMEALTGVTFEYITTGRGVEEFTALLPMTLATALMSPHHHVRVKWPKEDQTTSIASAGEKFRGGVRESDELPQFEYLPPKEGKVAHERPYSWAEFVAMNEELYDKGYDLLHVDAHPQTGSMRAVWKRGRYT